MSEHLTIGTLAKQGGVNVETIRYYQRRGLLQEPQKPEGGFRHYSTEAVKQVRFIKRAQALGFTLEEIDVLIRLDEQKSCRETREIAALKMKIIEQKIADLTRIRESLVGLVQSCDSAGAGTPCPIIHLLTDD